MARFTPPDDARARLLLAAREEFAAAGLAGSRIERLAAASSSNKAQVFHWFGSKEGLFDAVVAGALAEVADEVPLDVDDLPGYAGRLHDAVVRRPEVQRLATWHRLERGSSATLDAVASGQADAVAAVEHAQRAGTLPRTHRAPVLLALVLHVAVFWSETPTGFDALLGSVPPGRRRQAVVDAVTAILGG